MLEEKIKCGLPPIFFFHPTLAERKVFPNRVWEQVNHARHTSYFSSTLLKTLCIQTFTALSVPPSGVITALVLVVKVISIETADICLSSGKSMGKGASGDNT